MSTYEPGTVALKRDAWGRPRRVIPVIDGLMYDPATQKVVPKDAVVLDLADAPVFDLEDVVRNLRSRRGRTALWLADQIEAQTKPPRIPEPGLWGVVEAMSSWDTNTRTEYVRRSTEAGDDGGNNWEDGTGDWFAWPELIDPTLVREGVGS